MAVLDSGCGKTIIGENTLSEFRKLWDAAGVPQPEAQKEINHFRYGNGHSEVSSELVAMPVTLAQHSGVIRAAVVKGDAPLLLSRPAMKTLGAEMDFNKDELRLFSGAATIPMEVNKAGQYMVDVVKNLTCHASEISAVEHMTSLEPSPHVEEPLPSSEPCDEPQTASLVPASESLSAVQIVGKKEKSKDFWEIIPLIVKLFVSM